MKLVEILAKGRDKLNCQIDLDFEWFSATQVSDGDVCFSLNEKGTLQAHMDLNICKADDWVEAIVTRAQWEAERARIASESSPKVTITEKDMEFVNSDFYQDIVDRKREQELAAIACGKRSKEDQELWDKVAIAVIGGVVSSDAFHNYPNFQGNPEVGAEFAAQMADAFMAERAKRMKGKQ